MPDMLVRLYALPDPAQYYQRAREQGYEVRRAEPWERERLLAFAARFNPVWPIEAERAYSQTPISAFLAVKGPELMGFAAYECSRRGFFGPTGVRDDLRGNGIGAALLFRCLESMAEMGYGYAIIGGVGPAGFYEKVCGATLIPDSDPGVYRALYEMGRTPE